jgi:hypothetical protein
VSALKEAEDDFLHFLRNHEQVAREIAAMDGEWDKELRHKGVIVDRPATWTGVPNNPSERLAHALAAQPTASHPADTTYLTERLMQLSVSNQVAPALAAASTYPLPPSGPPLPTSTWRAAPSAQMTSSVAWQLPQPQMTAPL